MPDKVWLKVLLNLRVKEVNNLHLVCRNLHRIANLHVNPILRFEESRDKNLESLVESSRIFEELEFWQSDDYLSDPDKFEMIREYISFTGSHIKKLTINCLKVDQEIGLKLLNLLPNLKYLFAALLEGTGDETTDLVLKSTKIERMAVSGYSLNLGNFFKALEKCTIKELELSDWCEGDSELPQTILSAQQKRLRKLVLINACLDLPNDLKDCQLEHLEYIQNDFLRDKITIDANKILSLKNLKTLKLHSDVYDISAFNNFYYLQGLKELQVHSETIPNILNHLQFGVFNELEELNAAFEGASLESIREMKKITPNLKKIVVSSASSDTINALLETLENLEVLSILWSEWKLPDTVYPIIKDLQVKRPTNCIELDIEKISKIYPSLESFTLSRTLRSDDKAFFIYLLSELKQLKKLVMQFESELEPESVLDCFQEYGEHLKIAYISFIHPALTRHFAIEKSPGGSFCITENVHARFYEEWIDKKL